MRWLLPAALLCLANCSLYPPPDGINHSGGGAWPPSSSAMASSRSIPAPMCRSPNKRLEELQKTDPTRHYAGTTYRLSDGNQLPANWIIQTPDAWGKQAAAIPYEPLGASIATRISGCPCAARRPTAARRGAARWRRRSRVRASGRAASVSGPSDGLVDVIYKLVVSAQRSVDLVMLQPPADTRFLAALRNAVTWLAYSGRPVSIRAIVGSYPPDGVDAKALLAELVRDAGAAPGSRLRVYAAATRSCDASAGCDGLSWNHAKIVAVDGREAIVGGQNMWTPDYLAKDPAHDLSMRVEGPAARDAHRFADALWGSVCAHPEDAGVNAHYAFHGPRAPDADDACITRIDMPDPVKAAGGVPILSIGRLAQGITSQFADQSLIARDLMFGAARQTIRMVQQDVAFALIGAVDRSWPDSALGEFADLITVKHGDLWLVLSNPGAAGPIGTYSNGVPIETVAQKVKDVVAQRSGLKDPELSTLLCQHFHLAPLRFGPDAAWPDGKPIGTHAKFWMVDDRAFYIGSENLYPVDLQEFGYIVEDATAAADLRKAYWDKAWQWSSRAAISGADAPSCVFSQPAVAATPAPHAISSKGRMF